MPPSAADDAAIDRILSPPLNDDGFVPGAQSLARLVRWLADAGPGSRRPMRLLERLRQEPPLAAALAARLVAFLTQGDISRIFCDAGLPPRPAFLEEAGRRLVHRILPPPLIDRDPTTLISRIALRQASAAWLAALHPVWVGEVLAALPTAAPAFAALPRAIADALEVLALRLAARSEDAELRYRASNPELTDSPFYRLLRAVAAAAAAVRSGDHAATALGAVVAPLGECRVAIDVIRDHLARHGVSVDVVFRLDRMRQQLERIVLLTALIDPGTAPLEQRRRAMDFIAALLADMRRQARVRGLITESLAMLTRRIVASSGRAGAHYITSSGAEWRGMLASAAGGGVITAGTAALKIGIGALHLPLFLDWAASALDYAGSFLLMQGLGFTLATKQPPMTAAAFAHAMDEGRSECNTRPLSVLSARIVRSQLAAVIGNLGLVVVSAWALDALWVLWRGSHLLEAAYADHAIASFHPLASGTLFFAVITGFALWLSSAIAGWCENLSSYHRLPEAVRQSPGLARLLGTRRAQAAGDGLAHQVSGITGSIALGVLLATIAMFGKFTGTALDVRHITLSTGSITLACLARRPDQLFGADVAWALVGIACIGLLNFGVGFVISLLVAMRARGMRVRDCGWMVRGLVTDALSDPLPFLFPVKR